MNEQSIETAFFAMALFEEFKPMLAGKPAEVQGAVLVQLLAYWLAGHNPGFRDGALQSILQALPGLVDVAEFEIFGPEGFPTVAS